LQLHQANHQKVLHQIIWLFEFLRQVKAKVDLEIQQLVEMNEIEVGHQSIGDINANILAVTGIDVHNHTQLFYRRSIKCSWFKVITSKTKARNNAYKDHECVVMIQQMTPARVHK